jgi:hypothetical protein
VYVVVQGDQSTMGITATLVEQGNNRLRYLVASTATGGATLTITTTGGATPDLQTDSKAGPIKNISLAFANGLGLLAAGAMTQAQARAMWLGDNSDTVLGNVNVPRTIVGFTMRSGTGNWRVDANVDGSGHPVMTVFTDGISDGYLDVFTQGAIGI